MKVLFDFELFGDPFVDTHLIDIMQAMKAEFHTLLDPYRVEIIADAGLILVVMKEGKVALKYHSRMESETNREIQGLLNDFDWEALIERYSQWAKN